MSKFKAIWKKRISRKFVFKIWPVLVLPAIPIFLLMLMLVLRRFYFLPILFAIIASVLLWGMYILLEPLVGLSTELRLNIIEKLVPDIRKSSESITTLSAAAILLTFSVIQFLGKEVSYKENLIISWSFFAGSIVVGVIIGIMIYVFKSHYLALAEALQDSSKNKSEENKKRTKSLLNKTYNLVGVIVTCALMQLLTFFGAMIYAFVFVIKNI